MTLNGWHVDGDAQARPNGRIVARPTPIGVAVVGCGYWGPNLARNLSETEEFRLHALCDSDLGPLSALARKHPDAHARAHFDEVLADEAVEAVVIATPPA